MWNRHALTFGFFDINNQFVVEHKEYPTQKDWTFGINPITSFNFSIGDDDKPLGVFELAFTLHRWMQAFSLFEDKPLYMPIDCRFFHVQLTLSYYAQLNGMAVEIKLLMTSSI